MVEANTVARFVYLWPILNLSLFAIAYGLNHPGLILGKRPDGEINPILCILNLPWLIFSWAVWTIQAWLNREACMNRIGSSNIWIGRYPGIAYSKGDFDMVIDLTAEFPRPRDAPPNYICIPTLDGIQLKNTLSPRFRIRNQGKILVHCAQVHGRSATWTALFLAKEEGFQSTGMAYETILISRPAAKVSNSQARQLVDFDVHKSSE